MGGQGPVVVRPWIAHLVSIGKVGDIVVISNIAVVTLLVSLSPIIGSIEEVCVVLCCIIVGLIVFISVVLCGHCVRRRRKKRRRMRRVCRRQAHSLKSVGWHQVGIRFE